MRFLRALTRPLCATAVALGGLMVAAPWASANSVEITFAGINPLGGGQYAWIYLAELTPDNQVGAGTNAPHTATFFDFEGFVSGSFTPILAAGTYTVTDSTDAPVQTTTNFGTFTTDLAIGDIQFTYSGLPTLNPGPGELFMGIFTLVSTFNLGALDLVTTTDARLGSGIGNDFHQLLPVARDGGFIVPTPGVAAGSLALLGLVGARRRRSLA